MIDRSMIAPALMPQDNKQQEKSFDAVLNKTQNMFLSWISSARRNAAAVGDAASDLPAHVVQARKQSVRNAFNYYVVSWLNATKDDYGEAFRGQAQVDAMKYAATIMFDDYMAARFDVFDKSMKAAAPQIHKYDPKMREAVYKNALEDAVDEMHNYDASHKLEAREIEKAAILVHDGVGLDEHHSTDLVDSYIDLLSAPVANDAQLLDKQDPQAVDNLINEFAMRSEYLPVQFSGSS